MEEILEVRVEPLHLHLNNITFVPKESASSDQLTQSLMQRVQWLIVSFFYFSLRTEVLEPVAISRPKPRQQFLEDLETNGSARKLELHRDPGDRGPRAHGTSKLVHLAPF